MGEGMNRYLRTIIGVVPLSVAAASGATAATVTVGMPGFNPGALIAADSTMGSVAENVTGSINGVRADPWAGTSFEGTGAYTAVSQNASATYFFGGTTNAYSFLWGTPDTYNTLELLLDGVVVDSVAGGGTGIAGFADRQTNRFVTVTSDSVFNGLRFSSGGIAFEYAALQPDLEVVIAPVPLPAAGGMLLLALGGVAVLARRREA